MIADRIKNQNGVHVGKLLLKFLQFVRGASLM